MPEKQRSFRTVLPPDEAARHVVNGITSWKMGRVVGIKPDGESSFQITRAGRQSGSRVEFEIEASNQGSLITVWLITVNLAIKNPFTGVFASVDRSLREADRRVTDSNRETPQTSTQQQQARFKNSSLTLKEIRTLAVDDPIGQPLNDDTGALDRAVIVKERWNDDMASMILFANGLMSGVLALVKSNRITLDEIDRTMGIPEDSSDIIQSVHGLGAFSILVLVSRPEFSDSGSAVSLEESAPQVVAEVGAWFATLLVRLESAGRIDPLRFQ